MHVTPLILETVKLRSAAATARDLARAALAPAEINRLAAYASALETRADEIEVITTGIVDEWIVAHAS
ncbi:MAG: hypothetical protein ACM30I_02640 [Gemmatimonas sp.]